MSIDLSKIQEQVRGVLKSIGALKPTQVAAEPPADPDALDERLEGAAPTEEGMAAAGAEAAAGQGAEGGAAEGEGGEPEGDEGAGEGSGDGDGDEGGEGRPTQKALGEDDGTDAFGHTDLSDEDIRALEKSYGNGTGAAEPNELLKGGPDLESVLSSILQGIEDQQIVLQALHDEVQTLKAGHTATNRKLSKALSELQPEAHLEAPPAPIAAPKAVTRVVQKSLGDGNPEPPMPLTPDQIFMQMKAGTLSQGDAIAAARQSRAPIQ